MPPNLAGGERIMEWPATLALSELDKLRLESAVDESLRQRLVQDPASVLRERGIDVPEGVQVKVVEDSLETHTIALPPFVGSNLSNASLQAQSAAANPTWWCTTCTPTSPICAGSLASLTCVGQKA